MWLYHRIRSQKDADRMANSVDPDQTRSSLIWNYTICPDLSVRKLQDHYGIMVYGNVSTIENKRAMAEENRIFYAKLYNTFTLISKLEDFPFRLTELNDFAYFSAF